MSRAFVSERDGSFCTEQMQDCVWADENGKCPFSRCKREAELTKPAAESNRQDSGAERKHEEGER